MWRNRDCIALHNPVSKGGLEHNKDCSGYIVLKQGSYNKPPCFSIDKFSYGVAHRGASIRIPRQCDKDGKGYFEVRGVISVNHKRYSWTPI